MHGHLSYIGVPTCHSQMMYTASYFV